MTPCVLLGSFALWHFPSITAAVPGQAFLFSMVTPYQNLLAMNRCYARYPVLCPLDDTEAWSGCFLHCHGRRGQHSGEQISSPCHLHPGEKGTRPAVGKPWKWRLWNPVDQVKYIKSWEPGVGFFYLEHSVYNGGVLFPEQWNHTTEMILVFQKILLYEVRFRI